MKTFLQIFLFLLILSSSSIAQWSEPQDICRGYSQLYDPRAIAIGDTIQLVSQASVAYFRYFRSTDNGESWVGPLAPVDSFYGGSEQPDIFYSNGKLHLVWIGWLEGNFRAQIFHMSSTDEGLTWGTRHKVFNNNSALIKHPRLAAKGDTLFLACRTERQLLVFRSFDAGATWRDSVAVQNGPIVIDQPEFIFYCLGRLHLIYTMGIVGDSIGYEVHYSQSNDLGRTWLPDRFISTPEALPNITYDSQCPSAYCDSEGHLIVLWMDYKDGWGCDGSYGSILNRVSTDNGTSWLPEINLTDYPVCQNSSCTIIAGNLYAVWDDATYINCGHTKISYSNSEGFQNPWTEPYMISGPDSVMEYTPFIFYSLNGNDTTIHCIIRRDYPGRVALYHIKTSDLSGIPLDGLAPIAENFSLKAYPNPFNSSIMLTFKNPKGGDIDIGIYDLLGRKVKSFNLMGDREGKIIWDTRDAMGNKVSSGIYFAKASSQDISKTVKVTYLK
jgi:hypothetical protein